MNRRTSVIILLIAGIALIFAVLAWMFRPLIQKTLQPSPLPSGHISSEGGGAPPPKIVVSKKIAPSAPTPEERTVQEAVKARAMDFASRSGSYANADGFAAIKSAEVEAGEALRATLEAKRLELVKAHPLPGGESYGQTTRSLSSKLLTPPPLANRSSVQASVQAQRTVNAGSSSSVSYVEMTMDLERIGATWIVTALTEKAINQ